MLDAAPCRPRPASASAAPRSPRDKDDIGRLRAQAPRRSAPARAPSGPWPRAPRHGPRTGCPPHPSPRSSPRAPRAAAASSRCGRDRRARPHRPALHLSKITRPPSEPAATARGIRSTTSNRSAPPDRGQVVAHHVRQPRLVQEHVDMRAQASHSRLVMLCARLPDTRPRPLPRCASRLTVSSTASKTSTTRISVAGRASR
jgi:hypothetical protein